MKQYLDILQNILKNGKKKTPVRVHGDAIVRRLGNDTISLPNVVFSHNMSDGFPLLTSKKMSLKNIAVELEGFIQGKTDKQWYQERGCHIWDNWCNPRLLHATMRDRQCELIRRNPDMPFKQIVEMVGREEQQIQKDISDLGPIYGSQWRDWNGEGIDQLRSIVDSLHRAPHDRRMVCSAWNPSKLRDMALPPCHYSWVVTVIGDEIHLAWTQRSADFPIGVPYNIASYGLLLTLLAEESGFKPGNLTGLLVDCHIYTNQIEGCMEQLKREPRKLPTLSIVKPDTAFSIFNWTHKDIQLHGYEPHDKISFGEVTV